MARCAIYCRLSKEDIDKNGRALESESIQNQKAMLIDYATKHNWLIEQIYVDEDYSGIDSARPAFNRLLADAEQGLFNIILCKTQARFTRDMALIEKYLHHLFPIWGIRFVGMVDCVDTDIKGNKKARQINGLVNEWFLEDLSENIKSAFQIKRQKGEYIASVPLYGYIRDPHQKSRLIIDEEAAQVVQRIFQLYLEGYGYRGIAHILNSEHISNPNWYKFEHHLRATPNCKTKLWGGSTVKAILVHRTYVGDMVQGYHESISYKSQKQKIKPIDERVIIENTHEPIIEKAVFETVQKLMEQRTRPRKNAIYSPLSGKVRCLDCGNPLVQAGRTEKPYYRCLTYVDKGKEFCSIHSISVERLMVYVTDKIRQQMGMHYPIFLEDIKGSQIINDKKDRLLAKTDQLNKAIERNEKAIENLYLDKVSGLISAQQFSQFNQSFILENQRLENEVIQLSQDLVHIDQPVGEVDLAEAIKQLLAVEVLTSQLVNEFIEAIYIGEKDDQKKEQVIRIDWLI